MLMMIFGIENGETRFGPLVISTVWNSSIVLMPPMPAPMTQPKSSASSGVITIPESSIATASRPSYIASMTSL